MLHSHRVCNVKAVPALSHRWLLATVIRRPIVPGTDVSWRLHQRAQKCQEAELCGTSMWWVWMSAATSLNPVAEMELQSLRIHLETLQQQSSPAWVSEATLLGTPGGYKYHLGKPKRRFLLFHLLNTEIPLQTGLASLCANMRSSIPGTSWVN